MLCTALISSSSFASNEQEEATLVYKLQAGDRYMTETKGTVLTTNTEYEEEEIEVQQEFSIKLNLDVVEVDEENNSTLKVAYERIVYKAETPYGIIETDSSKEESQNDPTACLLKAIIGHEFFIKMSPNGAVLSMEGSDSLLEKLFASIEEADTPEKYALIENMRNQFGDKGLSNIIKEFPCYPQTAVSVGSTWEQVIDINAIVPVSLKRKTTLSSLSEETAKMDIEGTFSLSHILTSTDEMTLKMELDGTVKGTQEIERSSGMPMDVKCSQDMKGKVIYSFGKDNDAGCFAVPINVRVESETKTVKV